MSSAAPEPRVGDRVRIIKDFATIRYIGPVTGQEGTWVGVEWDDPARGKHDGSTGGVKYFECLSGHPTAGSFIRAEKVSFGVGVRQALLARYNNQTAEFGEEVRDDELYVHTAKQRRVTVQLVGLEKIQAQQSQVHLLSTARLVGVDVSYVGDAAELAATMPSLIELDLTSNLVSSWQLAVELLNALPKLAILNLSNNRLSLCTPPSPPVLPGLRALVLNDCGVSWQEVVALEPTLPELEELHLCGNSIRHLRDTAEEPASTSGSNASTAACKWQHSSFRKLQVVNLEDNALDSWHEVLRLQALPSLARLHVSSNPLGDLTLPLPHPSAAAPAPAQPDAAAAASSSSSENTAADPSSSPAHVCFPKLESLFLAGCQLSTWASVSELDKLPSLKELRLSGNPVLGLSKTGGRYEIIGRVAGLTSLNGAEVRPRERRDSELRYLQHVAADMGAAAAAPNAAEARAAVRDAHPRIKYLMETYGTVLATAAQNSQATGSLAASMVELKLTCVSASPTAKMGSQVKKLPRSTTLASLKQLVEKLFKVKAEQQVLYMKTPADPVPEELGADDDRTLAFFAMQDGYEVLIDEVDAEAARKAAADEAAAGTAAAEARLAEQLRTAARLQAEAGKAMGVQQPGHGAGQQ